MKKILLLGAAILYSTVALADTAEEREDLQYNLLDQLVIIKIKMDTWLDLGQLDGLLQNAKNVMTTFENMTTTAGHNTMEYKTLTANRNEASKIMNDILSIYTRRALPKSSKTQAPAQK
jgi:hypothetical protein